MNKRSILIAGALALMLVVGFSDTTVRADDTTTTTAPAPMTDDHPYANVINSRGNIVCKWDGQEVVSFYSGDFITAWDNIYEMEARVKELQTKLDEYKASLGITD